LKKRATAKAKKTKKEEKKHRFLHPYSPPNLGSMRLCGSFLLIPVITHIVFFSPIDLPVVGKSGELPKNSAPL
jgi:hypothetical protein